MTGSADARPFPPVMDLLPHRAPMLLLERVLAADDEAIEVEFTVPAAGWFLDDDGGMPAWLGVELMAQAIAAHVGFEASARGRPPRPGVLLGTRVFRAGSARLAAGTRLTITARLALRDESGFAAYDCHIAGPDGAWATATVKAYQPADFMKFLAEATAT